MPVPVSVPDCQLLFLDHQPHRWLVLRMLLLLALPPLMGLPLMVEYILLLLSMLPLLVVLQLMVLQLKIEYIH
jgi:hypothetical protein